MVDHVTEVGDEKTETNALQQLRYMYDTSAVTSYINSDFKFGCLAQQR